MHKLLIKGGEVVFPDRVEKADILIENGKIAEIGNDLRADSAEKIDAKGKTVFPGLIDMHVHLREPDLSIKRI